MIDIDPRTLTVLSAALDQAEREGRFANLVERLNALNDLGADTRCVLFDRDGDIDFVVFARDGIAWTPVTHGCLVSRIESRVPRFEAA